MTVLKIFVLKTNSELFIVCMELFTSITRLSKSIINFLSIHKAQKHIKKQFHENATRKVESNNEEENDILRSKNSGTNEDVL